MTRVVIAEGWLDASPMFIGMLQYENSLGHMKLKNSRLVDGKRVRLVAEILEPKKRKEKKP